MSTTTHYGFAPNELQQLFKDSFVQAWQNLMPKTSHGRIFTAVTAILFVLAIANIVAYAAAWKWNTFPAMFRQHQFSPHAWGNMEILGHLMVIVTIGYLITMAAKFQQYYWAGLIFLFTVLVIDDMFEVHEGIARSVKDSYGLGVHIGEPIGFALLALLVFLPWLTGLVAAHKNSEAFRDYLIFTSYIAIMSIFGIGVDALHSYLEEYSDVSDTLMIVIEDGMELFMMCICALNAHGVWNRYRLRRSIG